MKKKLKLFSATVIIFFLIFGICKLREIWVENQYQSAIELIKICSYEKAMQKLEKINDENLKDVNLCTMHRYDPSVLKLYKNSALLYYYSLAQYKYNNINLNYCRDEIYNYLKAIPFDYDAELCEEIKNFKSNYSVEYYDYIADKRRKEAEMYAAERKRKKQEFYSQKLPMDYFIEEEYIDYSMMGKHDEYEERIDENGILNRVYYWKSNDGHLMLEVVYKENNTYSYKTRIHNKHLYWTDDLKPCPEGKPRKYSRNTNSNSSSKKKKYDPYNIDEYDEVEDFYDDNADEFDSFEDAEDYFDEYYD